MHLSKVLTFLLFFSCAFDLLGAQKEITVPLQLTNGVHYLVNLSLYSVSNFFTKQNVLAPFEYGQIRTIELPERTSLGIEVVSDGGSKVTNYVLGNHRPGKVACYAAERFIKENEQLSEVSCSRIFSLQSGHTLKVIIAVEGLKLELIP